MVLGGTVRPALERWQTVTWPAPRLAGGEAGLDLGRPDVITASVDGSVEYSFRVFDYIWMLN